MTVLSFTTNTGTAGDNVLGVRANYDGTTDTLFIDNVVLGRGGNDSVGSTILPIDFGGQLFSFAITVDGGNGDDNVSGYNATDILIGGAGNDTVGGYSGSTMSGGSGIDTISLDAHLSAAAFALSYAAQAAASVGLADGSTIGGFEKFLLQTGSGNDTFDLSGDANALDSNFHSGAGNDTLIVNAATLGGIIINGDIGTDRLIADLSGLTVAVTLSFAGASGQLVAGGLSVGAAVEIFDVTGGSGNDSLAGGDFADTFAGGGGNDSLDGGDGKDRIDGGGGGDLLGGGKGRDTISGGGGQDTLQGGAQGDRLSGGSGADTFDFDAPDESGTADKTRDVITDFVSGIDVVDLSSIDTDASAPGDQAFDYIDGAAFGSVAGELRFGTVGGRQILEGDLNGDGAADFQIELSGVAALAIADISL